MVDLPLGGYRSSQTDDEFVATFALPAETSRASIRVTFASTTISLQVAGAEGPSWNAEPLLGRVDPDGCNWSVERGGKSDLLVLTLEKAIGGKEWRALTRREAEAAAAEAAQKAADRQSGAAPLYRDLHVVSPDDEVELVERNEHDSQAFLARFEALREEKGLDHDEALGAFFDLFDNNIQLYRLNQLEALLADVVPVCRRRGGEWEVRAVQALGFVKWKQGKYREALPLFHEMERSVGPSAALSENIAHTYNSLGELDKAEEYFRAAQRALEIQPAGCRGSLGGILLGLGIVRSRLGRHTEAEEVLRKACDFYKVAAQGAPSSLLAKASSSLLKTLLTLAQAEQGVRRAALQEEAEALARGGVDTFVSTCGASSPLTGTAWKTLGELLWEVRHEPGRDLEAIRKESTHALHEALKVMATQDHLDLCQCMTVHQAALDCQLQDVSTIRRAAFAPLVPTVKGLADRVSRELVQDGNAGVWYKATGATLAWAGVVGEAEEYLSRAEKLLVAERSIDTSSLVKECRDLKGYCQRVQAGGQQMIKELDVPAKE